MKQMKNVLSIIIILIFTQSIYAQEPIKNSLALRYGTSYLMRQDQIFSPFIKKNLSPISISVEYKNEKKYIHTLEFNVAMHKTQLIESYEFIWNDGEKGMTWPSSLFLLDLNYYFGFKKELSEKLKLSYGLASANKIQAGENVWGFASIFGYYANFGLNLWTELDYKLNDKNSISANVSIPTLSWTARSPYNVNDGEFIQNTVTNKAIPTFFAYLGDGHIRTWNTSQIVDFGISYKYHFSDKISAGLNYDLEFIKFSAPRMLTSIRNTAQIQFIYTFKKKQS